jgi:hypothetical protein
MKRVRGVVPVTNQNIHDKSLIIRQLRLMDKNNQALCLPEFFKLFNNVLPFTISDMQ